MKTTGRNLAQRRRYLDGTEEEETMRTITTTGLVLAVLAASIPAADARGGHGADCIRHSMHVGAAGGAGGFAADSRHADDRLHQGGFR